jgi:hypothetical protein
MNNEANRISQLEVARQILRLTGEVVDYTTTAEKELYDAAERLAELVVTAHNWTVMLDQGYVPVDNPDAELATLTDNLPPWITNPRPRVQIEPYIPDALLQYLPSSCPRPIPGCHPTGF